MTSQHSPVEWLPVPTKFNDSFLPLFCKAHEEVTAVWLNFFRIDSLEFDALRIVHEPHFSLSGNIGVFEKQFSVARIWLFLVFCGIVNLTIFREVYTVRVGYLLCWSLRIPI
jgi:hypothetical protein